MTARPRLLFTMGDVAGIGPEIIARAWPALQEVCQPAVVGDPNWLRKALRLVGSAATVRTSAALEWEEASASVVPCVTGGDRDLSGVEPGKVSAPAGRAAYDFLCVAIDATLAGRADGIVTCPLHKEGLHAAGLNYPGHTEILAQRTGSQSFAMLLYVRGLAVAHVTLHMALRDVFRHLSIDSVFDKIGLLDETLTRLLERRPRIGVAALNPHASDGGLFGDEEATIIRPAVELAQRTGFQVSGPWPSDTLFVRARRGEFDGVVAMYHDQGHIALKLLSDHQAVNISAGLPIVRTSVAHGTAYDIAGQGIAKEKGLIEAARIAALLARRHTCHGGNHANDSLSDSPRRHGGQPDSALPLARSKA
jgi:4-hydroxythreonine-4-phosphate dehydrogenase